MMKSESEVEQDFYDALKGTSLILNVNGSLYKYGTRPFDSDKEDVVVKVTTLTASQLQDGVVSVLAYCKNVDAAEYGRMMPNKARLMKLERLCFETLYEIKQRIADGYNDLRLETAISSRYDAEIKQSHVIMKIKFKFLTD